MSRYFFAVSPPDPLSRRIDALRARWGHPHHKVEPHVTVKAPFDWQGQPEAFLGPVQAATATVAPFDMRLDGTGRFGEARVLFLTVAADQLKALHLAVAGALEQLLPADSRGHEREGYSAHLTLAVGRFGIDSAGMADMERAAQTELADLPAFTVDSLRCYQWATSERRWTHFRDIRLGR